MQDNFEISMVIKERQISVITYVVGFLVNLEVT